MKLEIVSADHVVGVKKDMIAVCQFQFRKGG